MSHPSWVCGLKHKNPNLNRRITYVTPFVGVWIETDLYIPLRERIKSHPSWVCGLKQTAHENLMYQS